MLKLIKKKKLQISVGLLCAALFLFIQLYQLPIISLVVSRINGAIYDTMTYWAEPKHAPASNVVIINIDEYSVQQEGRWPWPRDKLATLLANLKKAGVVVVAFDIVMSEAEINHAHGLKEKILDLRTITIPVKQKILPLLDQIYPQIDSDDIFARALKQHDVVLGYLFQHDNTLKKGGIPKPLVNIQPKSVDLAALQVPIFQGYNGILPLFLKAAPHAGFVSNIPDLDGVIRHALLLAKYENKLYTSLTLSAVMRYLLTDEVTLHYKELQGKEILSGITVGGVFIPMNRDGEVLIPYWGLAGTMDYYSASDIIQNKLPANALAGAIAIVGSTMVLLGDFHPAPIAHSFFGVEMNANIMAGILGQHLRTEYDWHTIGGIVGTGVLGFVAAVIFPFFGPVVLLIVYLISLFMFLLGGFMLFWYYKLYVATAVVLLMITLQFIINFTYSFILERRQKNRIRSLFGQYVPPSYVEELTDSLESAHMQGQTRDMTVFFADIRNFTSISETLDSSEVKRLLNEFFTPITNIIFNHKGTIDKYVGDMIMAFWGAPLADREHSQHAIEAALNIQSSLAEINTSLTQAGLPNVTIGMGISSGLMNVGDMGSAFRRSYTVIGDTVNIASRLQDLTKFYQVDILVSEATQSNQEEFVWRVVDKVRVKGRKGSVLIYEPIGYKKNLSQEVAFELATYKQALDAYYKQDWHNAKTTFANLQAKHPKRYIYQLYLERINELMQNPPEKTWDGTFIHTHK